MCNCYSRKGKLEQELKLLANTLGSRGCPAQGAYPRTGRSGALNGSFRDMRMIDNIDELQQCITINALHRLHDRLVVELNQWRGRELIRDEYGQPVPLPEPPLPATDNIFPYYLAS